MPRLKIIQVLHTLNVGGAELLAAGLARRFKDQFDFSFVCLDELGELGATLREEGFTIEVLDRQQGFDRKCARGLRDIYNDFDADILHAHQYTPFFYSLAAGFLRGRPPVLFTEHGRFFPDLPSRKRTIYNNLMLRKGDRVIAVGESVRQALINNEGLAANRIQVIYNGVDLTRFERTQQAVHQVQVRESLGLETGDFVITLVGRLDYLKDHSTAIRTAKRLRDDQHKFKMLFIGDGVERKKIENEIESLDLNGHVLLLGTRHDVPEILQISDVCFLSSISEGIPLTLIEGMASQLPVVATNVGGIREVVLPGETGYLSKSGDDESLACQISELIDDIDTRQSFAQAGLKRVREIFSIETMHNQYEILYNEMANKN